MTAATTDPHRPGASVTPPTRRSPVPMIVATAALAAILLAGCDSGSGTPSAASGAAGSKAASSGPGGSARGRFGGGLSGPIASVGSASFTVTERSRGTATVAWTSSTSFTRTGPGTLADVTAGSCVAVTEAAGSDPSTGSVDADSVRISRPVNGSCPAGFGTGTVRPPSGSSGAGGFGGFRGGSASPGSGRQGAGGRGSGGGFAGRLLLGSVHSVSATTFLVDVTTPGTAGASVGTTTTAVDVSGSTTYTVTTVTSSAALAVGECARVFSGFRLGAASSSGAVPTGPAVPPGPVTAAAVSLSSPVGGSCTSGFPGRPSQGGPASGSSGANA